MSARGGRLAVDDPRRIADERIVLERSHHDQREVHSLRAIAGKRGVAHVAAPYGQSAISARSVLRRHWAVGLLNSRKSPGPATLRQHDAVNEFEFGLELILDGLERIRAKQGR